MKKNTLFWITGIVLIAVILLFVPSILMFGRGNFMHSGYGMMGDYGYGMMSGGWMAFGWIIPAVILIFIIAGGVTLGNTLSNRGTTHSAAQEKTCPTCSKPANLDWQTCPYCSTALQPE
ncbi:MAG: zinc ribbon domain-containing protein [Chloroflexota bacterium]